MKAAEIGKHDPEVPDAGDGGSCVRGDHRDPGASAAVQRGGREARQGRPQRAPAQPAQLLQELCAPPLTPWRWCYRPATRRSSTRRTPQRRPSK